VGADWSGGRIEWPTLLMFTGMGGSLHSFYRCFAGLVALDSCRNQPIKLVDTWASQDLPWRFLLPKWATCLSVFNRFIYPDIFIG
jgi:hypothetical protein